MSLKAEVTDMKEKVENVKEENKSFAMELVDTLKKQNKRMFIGWMVTFIAFIGLLGYVFWLHNDISTIEMENTQEISEVQTIENSNIINGE